MERNLSRRSFLKLCAVTSAGLPDFMTTLVGNDPPLVVGASNDGRLNVLFKAYLGQPTDVPQGIQESVQADKVITQLIDTSVSALACLVSLRLDAKKLSPESEAKILAALTTLKDIVSEAQTVPDSQPDAAPTPDTKPHLNFDYPQAKSEILIPPQG